jgi:hypothetical protein
MVLNVFFYIKCLLTGNTAAIIKFKELNQLYKTFKNSKYRYITKDKKITHLFIQKIFTLYQSLIFLKPLLEASLFSMDDKKSIILLNYFIDANLPPEMVSKKEKFTKEIMWQKLVESDNPTKTMKSIQEEFNMYKNYFTKTKMPRFEAEYFLLYKLYSLSTFNFELFFSKFDPDFNPSSKNPPAHNPVGGDEILSDISDLYYLITTLPAKIDLSGAFTKLFFRISEESNKSLSKNAVAMVNNIYKIIYDEISPDKLITLCKYISENPKLKINAEQKFFSILDKYRKEIEERFIKNKDFIMEKFSEQSQMQEIKTLFKDKNLMNIKGYNEDLIQALDDSNCDAISGIQALKITKTFIFEVYEVKIKDYINTLILEGVFYEREYQSNFSNKFFSVNELLDYINNFEDNIAEGGTNSFRFLGTMLSKNMSGNEIKIQRTIELINEKIENCNKKCAETFYNLASKIYEILQDYKTQKPIRINNIKSIKGSTNKEFINNLANGYSLIAKYIKIIKSFITTSTPTVNK